MPWVLLFISVHKLTYRQMNAEDAKLYRSMSYGFAYLHLLIIELWTFDFGLASIYMERFGFTAHLYGSSLFFNTVHYPSWSTTE